MKVLCCAGTRPEIIKMAPVVHALVEAGLEALVIDTGQHAACLSAALFDFLRLKVHKRLDVLRPNSSLGSLNARLLSAVEETIGEIRPDVVLVQGDTASALQMGVAAFLHGVPVGHVEAGLRTHDLNTPFPEEFNRTLLSRFSRWNFAPTPRAEAQLRGERVPGHVEVTGNTVVDALHLSLKWLEEYRGAWPDALPARLERSFTGLRRIMVTMHRRENWGAGIRGVAQAVGDLLTARPDLGCVWPLHPNPSVAEVVRETLGRLPAAAVARLALISPLSYPDMVWLMKSSWLLLTDSGGIQEEAVSLGLPVLIARSETERQEVLECGAGRLIGTDRETVRETVLELLHDPARYRTMASIADNPFGDGRAARRIAAALVTACRN